jgi:hypothetical protein
MSIRFTFAAWAFLACDVLAHGGELNSDGCHNIRKTGDNHCHRAPSVAAVKATQGAQPPARQQAAAVPESQSACTAPDRGWSKDFWINDGLERAPTAQCNAIAKRDLAACRSKATVSAERAFPSRTDCSDLGIAGYACSQRLNEAKAKRGDLFQDLLHGCMGKRGWALVVVD